MKLLVVLATLLHLAYLEELREPFTAPDICKDMKPDQGTCGDYSVKWFFNPQDKECKKFMYSGCGGNQNRFDTETECQQTCTGVVSEQSMVLPEAAQNTEAAVDTEATQDTYPEETQDDDDNEEFDDGEEDERLIHQFLNLKEPMDINDSEMLKEAMATMDVSAIEVSYRDVDGMPDEQPMQQNIPEAQESPEPFIGEEDEDEDDGYIDDNGEEVDSFITQLGDAINPADIDTLLESIVQAGAIAMKSTEELTEDMEIVPFMDIPRQVAQTQAEVHAEFNKELSEAKAVMENVQQSIGSEVSNRESHSDIDDGDDGDDDDDDEPEGIDVDEEYPPLRQFISPEDKETLAATMSVFEVVEALSGGRQVQPGDEVIARLPMFDEQQLQEEAETEIVEEQKEQPEKFDESEKESAETPTVLTDVVRVVDMNDDEDDDDEADEQDPVDEILNHEKDAIFSTEGINPADRSMLSELVSQYDVTVMEEKNKADIMDEVKDVKQAVNEQVAPQEENGLYNSEKNRLQLTDGLIPSICTLPPVKGPCRAKKLKWFFNQKTGNCEKFFYGGCRGNANGFRSQRKCIKTCGGTENI